jgi:hypothetical protein
VLEYFTTECRCHRHIKRQANEVSKVSYLFEQLQ